jgi:hypothetical protein
MSQCKEIKQTPGVPKALHEYKFLAGVKRVLIGEIATVER